VPEGFQDQCKGAVAACEDFRALRQPAEDGRNSRAKVLTHHARTITVVLEFVGTLLDVAWARGYFGFSPAIVVRYISRRNPS
jgi:hypothetical protein